MIVPQWPDTLCDITSGFGCICRRGAMGMVKSSGTTERERIARRLSRAGVASRRAAERLVSEGRVRIRGRLCQSPAERVSETDLVEVDDRPIPEVARARLWRFHKPTGVIVTRTDPQGRVTLYDLLPDGMPPVMPVGRLDFASEGLLLLTNDGAVKRHLELPANGFVRVYRARVRGRPAETDLTPLREGIALGGEHFRPMRTRVERQGTTNAWIRLELKEGRNREVRRALQVVGFPVSRLVRVAFGPFQLGGLPQGGLREISSANVRSLGAPGSPGGRGIDS